MEKEAIERLKKRNDRIIRAILRKAGAVCPDSIALVGIAGSFCSGDIHEGSDLDLCIVTTDGGGAKISSCFILDGIGHDIHCTPWRSLEAMAEYSHPHVAKLLDLDIVYRRGDEDLERYMALRSKLRERLDSPFSVEDARHLTAQFESALREYAETMLIDDAPGCKYASARMLVFVEYVVYLANKAYMKRGIRRVPEELEAMKALPGNFLRDYRGLIAAVSCDDIKSCATLLMSATRKFATALTDGVAVRKEPMRLGVRGTYEEIYSNWRNKMRLAARERDPHLALATMSSCQEFYDWIAVEYSVERIRLFDGFRIDDLHGAAERFNCAMEEYRRLYGMVGETVKSYAGIDAFEKDYLQSV